MTKDEIVLIVVLLFLAGAVLMFALALVNYKYAKEYERRLRNSHREEQQ